MIVFTLFVNAGDSKILSKRSCRILKCADIKCSFSKDILRFPLLFLFQKIAYIDYYVVQVR